MVKVKKILLKDMVGTTSKYHSKKIIIDGIKFDSIREGKRYEELKILEKAGLIKDIELQKEFILQPSFKKNGKTYRKITYKADFYYYDNHLKRYVVEDVKGMKTEVYKLKKKLFEFKYPDLKLDEI